MNLVFVSMYRILGLLILIPSFLLAQSPRDFQQKFPRAYQEALNYLEENQTLIQKSLQSHQADLSILIPAVFPEIVRFSKSKNAMELASLEVLYTRYGNDYADFSIGRFQMKPSFIEKLEKYIEVNQWENFKHITQFKESDVQAIRRERLQRLNQLTWQLLYLSCFYHIVNQAFPLAWPTLENKIRFFAAAYNRGFDQTQAEIEKWQNIRAFPDGFGHYKKQYIYTDIAFDFHQRHFYTIFYQ